MGAWSSLEIEPKRVHDAHPTAPFVRLAAGGGYEFADGVDPAAPEAKQLVADEMLGRLGRYVARFGSQDALLDTVAGDARLAGSLQSALAYGLLHSEQFSGRNRRGDVFDQDADYFLGRLKQAVRALVDTAPAVLGLTGSSGSAVGGSLASVYT